MTCENSNNYTYVLPKINKVKLFQTTKLAGDVSNVEGTLNDLNSILTVHFQLGNRWSGTADVVDGHTSIRTCVWSVNICDCQSMITARARHSQSWICCDVQSLFILRPWYARWRVSFNYTPKNDILSFHSGKAFRILGNLRSNWGKWWKYKTLLQQAKLKQRSKHLSQASLTSFLISPGA